jgi:hypothetical protein
LYSKIRAQKKPWAVDDTGRYSVKPSIIAIKTCNVFIYALFGFFKNSINGYPKTD